MKTPNKNSTTLASSPVEKATPTQLLDSIPIASFILNTDHVITHWNLAITQASGLTAEVMVGTKDQWKPFYPSQRPTMADLILDSSDTKSIDAFYLNKYKPSAVLNDAYEAEDYFPDMGNGEWLSFTASPIYDANHNIIGALETLVVISDRKKAEFELIQGKEKYRELSIIDDLTGLFNSRHLYDQLPTEIERSRRYKQPLSVCMFDIDNFKSLNDTYGHLFGNVVLENFAKLIKSSIRGTDTGYRYGGEEFIIILPSASIEGALIMVDRIRVMIEQVEFKTDDGEPVSITVSGGLADLVLEDEDNSDSLLRRVDQAMYEAKNLGKNRIVTAKL